VVGGSCYSAAAEGALSISPGSAYPVLCGAPHSTGFRWLKGPNMVAPMFLNTPARIAAIGMVFVLALLVRNYIQAVVRANLAEREGLTFPNMDYKPTKSPTTENVFWLFRNVGSVVVSKAGVEIDRRVTGLDEHCRLAMRLLGVSERAFLDRRKRT
jgi:hypothetical protein